MKPISQLALTRRSVTTLGLLMAATLAAPTTVLAADYPQRLIKLIVPYTSGTAADITARMLAEKLTPLLKQTVLVENRAGASGIIGTDAVAKAPADGYTLLMSVSTHVISPAFRKTPYDPVKDFAPIAEVAVGSFVVVTHPSNPSNNLKELIAYIKAQGDKATYGSPGIASTGHLFTNLFQTVTGTTNMRHVPGKGFTAATMDLMQNETTMLLTPVEVALPLIRAGKLKVFAQTGIHRSSLLPDVPTVAEAGYPDYEVELWVGLYAPKATPQAIVTRLNAEVNQVLGTPEMRVSMSQQGFDPVIASPEALGALTQSEFDRWSDVIRKSGITPE
jgi:tripartite-type tricarboxylate transporter receptor subunit TctC